MTEITKIEQHINGETPSGKYDILRVEGIDNPKEVMDNFKKAIISILKNPQLDKADPKWEQLLPQRIIHIVNQLDEEDFKNDDLVFPISSIISAVRSKTLKEWQWYSSKISDTGFEVYFEGIFRARFTWFVRFQGIPLSKIFIEREGVTYPLKVYKDVMTYKKFETKNEK
jgi:hypothetical protein